MSIGIIDARAIGSSFARALARAGIPAIISNSRGPESLKELDKELVPMKQAGTREEAAQADIVLVAVNWSMRRIVRSFTSWTMVRMWAVLK